VNNAPYRSIKNFRSIYSGNTIPAWSPISTSTAWFTIASYCSENNITLGWYLRDRGYAVLWLLT
jgi:hypothetical protein